MVDRASKTRDQKQGAFDKALKTRHWIKRADDKTVSRPLDVAKAPARRTTIRAHAHETVAIFSETPGFNGALRLSQKLKLQKGKRNAMNDPTPTHTMNTSNEHKCKTQSIQSQEVLEFSRVGSGVFPRPRGRVRTVSKPRGSSRVGSGGVGNLTGRVGSGRVGSGQEVFQYHGSGRVSLTRSDPRTVIRLVKSNERKGPLSKWERAITKACPEKKTRFEQKKGHNRKVS